MNISKRERELEVELGVEQINPYSPGQIRLWVRGRDTMGPVKLIHNEWSNHEPSPSWAGPDYRIWRVEDLRSGEMRNIPEFDIGRSLTEMEVLGWMAK